MGFIFDLRDMVKKFIRPIFLSFFMAFPSPAISECVKGDCFDGQGVYVYKNSTYSGHWKSGKREGKGKRLYHDGTFYDGEWRAGRPDGLGTFQYTSGQKYVGQWQKGKRHGQGDLVLVSGKKYPVVYAHDSLVESVVPQFVGLARQCETTSEVIACPPTKKNGTFVLENIDGSKYDGEFVDGKYHGQGILAFADGSMYKGKWKEGLPPEASDPVFGKPRDGLG